MIFGRSVEAEEVQIWGRMSGPRQTDTKAKAPGPAGGVGGHRRSTSLAGLEQCEAGKGRVGLKRLVSWVNRGFVPGGAS